jgi:hypothetical protein
MTSFEFKAAYEAANPGSFYFSRDTLRFFGDTMANYGVRDIGDYWELYRRKAVKHGLRDSAYFRKGTFKRIWIRGEVAGIK